MALIQPLDILFCDLQRRIGAGVDHDGRDFHGRGFIVRFEPALCQAIGHEGVHFCKDGLPWQGHFWWLWRCVARGHVADHRAGAGDELVAVHHCFVMTGPEIPKFCSLFRRRRAQPQRHFPPIPARNWHG